MEKPTLREILFAETQHSMLIPDGEVTVIDLNTNEILVKGGGYSDKLFELNLLDRYVSSFGVSYDYGRTVIYV